MDKVFELFPADELVERILTYNPKTNEKLIREAYEYGREMHEGQTRHSGEPYFSHPIEVACILNPTRMDQVQVAAEAGLIMPRKSTYFYPKVISGTLFNILDPSEVIEIN